MPSAFYNFFLPLSLSFPPLQFLSRQASIDYASRQLDEHVKALKRRMMRAEAAAKARGKESEGLVRQLEASKAAEYESASGLLQVSR